jgi:hypothetical protein
MTMRYSTETQTSLDQHRPVTSAEAGWPHLWEGSTLRPHKSLSYGAKIHHGCCTILIQGEKTTGTLKTMSRIRSDVGPSCSSADPPDDILQRPGPLEQLLL